MIKIITTQKLNEEDLKIDFNALKSIAKKQKKLLENIALLDYIEELEESNFKPQYNFVAIVLHEKCGCYELLQHPLNKNNALKKIYSTFKNAKCMKCIIKMGKHEYEYMLLARLQQDCEYFLGAGNRNEKFLHQLNVKDQIKEMKRLYNLVSVKPEWLTWEQIIKYEEEMLRKEPITLINIPHLYCGTAKEGVYINITRSKAIEYFNNNKTIIILGSDYPLGIKRTLYEYDDYYICYKCKDFNDLSRYEVGYLKHSNHDDFNKNGLDYYIYQEDLTLNIKGDKKNENKK